MPARLNATTRLYFEKLAPSARRIARRATGVSSNRRFAAAERYLAEHEPEHYAALRTTLVPTMLQAGIGPNVIPSSAEAVIDIRGCPTKTSPRLHDPRLSTALPIPLSPSCRWPLTGPCAPPSPIESPMYRILEHAASRGYTGATVLPAMMIAATDMAQLRARGIHAYGIGPAMTQRRLHTTRVALRRRTAAGRLALPVRPVRVDGGDRHRWEEMSRRTDREKPGTSRSTASCCRPRLRSRRLTRSDSPRVRPLKKFTARSLATV